MADDDVFLLSMTIMLAVSIGLGILVVRWGRRVTSDPQAHPVGRSLWPLVKWPLVALGAFGILGLTVTELREKRVGLGLGVTLYCLWETIHWTTTQWRAHGNALPRWDWPRPHR